jgi:hypothetical protein
MTTYDGVVIVFVFASAAASAQGCADTNSRPTHTARSDCHGAAHPPLPDGKSVLTCEKDESGFRWSVSQAPADLATCPSNAVIELGCVYGERGRVAVRTSDGDGGFFCETWGPVCRER